MWPAIFCDFSGVWHAVPVAGAPADESCAACRFWRPPDDAYSADAPGSCRRNSPSPETDVASYTTLRATWPETLAGDWCGDHEGRMG